MASIFFLLLEFWGSEARALTSGMIGFLGLDDAEGVYV
jgi:hypothetical protein